MPDDTRWAAAWGAGAAGSAEALPGVGSIRWVTAVYPPRGSISILVTIIFPYSCRMIDMDGELR